MYMNDITSSDSAAAAPRETQNVQKFPTVNETKIAIDNAKQLFWYNSGVRAKQKGYSNTSPFYKNATADYFFKCGYEGATFKQAQEALTTKIKDFLESEPEIKEVLNELQPQKS